MSGELTAPAGRRARNKTAKLERIKAAARELLAASGASGLTTAAVAKRADVAAGTLFLYAKTKGELLLLAQNTDYESALETGIPASESCDDLFGALDALWAPVFACNRKNVENGRAYLREVMFGNPGDPNHAQAISHMQATEAQTARLIAKFSNISGDEAAALAVNVSAIAFVLLSSPLSAELDVESLISSLISQCRLMLRGL
ncbi:MAG: TetR/AcrR family transcriptional regulator [Micrococcales bacterium]